MSEPVIKAVGRRCPQCREYADHAIPWMHCSFCDADTVALYGPDALVRVARECNRLWDESTAFDDETAEANRVVDRLTKGET